MTTLHLAQLAWCSVGLANFTIAVKATARGQALYSSFCWLCFFGTVCTCIDLLGRDA